MSANPFDEAFVEAVKPVEQTAAKVEPKPAAKGSKGIVVHKDLIQGSEEWFAARLGLLTASEMHLIVAPATLKAASNDKERAHVFEIAAQRISNYVEPSYVSFDMERGKNDESDACLEYDRAYEQTSMCGFITNDRWGFTIGYSPDRTVGDDGLIECKSRKQKLQVEAIVNGIVPPGDIVQCQVGLMVSERKWLDYISYSGGLPMMVLRVYPDPVMQSTILEIAAGFEARVKARIDEYNARLASDMRLVPTERKIEQEMYV